MEFSVQNVYLIYTWLIVHTTLNLAYSKGHIYFILLIYDIILLFQNLLCSFVICGHVTVTCDITLTLNPKSENKKINRNENENEERNENNSSPPSSTLT